MCCSQEERRIVFQTDMLSSCWYLFLCMVRLQDMNGPFPLLPRLPLVGHHTKAGRLVSYVHLTMPVKIMDPFPPPKELFNRS